jgi:hypothetical protein
VIFEVKQHRRYIVTAPFSLQSTSGISLVGILVGLAAMALLMAGLVNFTNTSAKTLQYQERASAFEESSILIQHLIRKKCDSGNYVSFTANIAATTGFPLVLGSLPSVSFAVQKIVTLGKNQNFNIDKIRFMQDGPVIGTGVKFVPTHLEVTASLQKISYVETLVTRTYDVKKLTRDFPIMVTIDPSSGVILGCTAPSLSKEESCVSKGGSWLGDYSTPRCLLP